MDIGSRPFKARYRPFRDSDQEVEIEWFPAAPGALPLGFVSNVTIPYWEQNQFEYTDGNLPLTTAEPTGKPTFRPGTGRGHVCGTREDFERGPHFDPDITPITYGAQGLPTCCGAPVPLRGGARDGGRVEVVTEVAPGPNCPAAANLPELATGAGHVEIGVENWWRFPVTGGEDYRFTFPSLPHVIGFQVLEGADCFTSVLRVNTAITNASPPTDVTATFGPFFWIHTFIVIADTSPMDYSVVWEQL